MLPENKPIIFNTPQDTPAITIYFAHDIHKGSELHDREKWERFKRAILSQPNNYIIWVGDYCDFAVVGSKGDVYAQTCSPHEQKEWFTEQLVDLADRTIAIVPGNHEDNRITKTCGLFPVYDSALIAGIGNRYRQTYAMVDIGVGSSKHGAGSQRQQRYVGFVAHRLRDCKHYNGSDFVEGIDFAASGHDHEPSDHPRAKVIYDPRNKQVLQKEVEVIDSGSFMTYGGYAARDACRPKSSKIYTLTLFSGRRKRLETHGFRV
jgi:hypothetical protein